MDGQLVFYNDSGNVYCYNTSEKNPYYFFIDDGKNAGWYRGYGKNMYEAAKTLSSSILSIDGNHLASRIFDKVVTDSVLMVSHSSLSSVDSYEWITIDSFNNRKYDTSS